MIRYLPPRERLASLSNLLWAPDNPSPAPRIGEVRVCGGLPPILHVSSLMLCERKRINKWVTHTTSPSTSVAYTDNRVPRSAPRPGHDQTYVAAGCVGRQTINQLGSTLTDGNGDNATVGKVAMVSKGVEARAGTTEVVGPRGHPSVFAGNVDQLIFVKSGEWSALSLLVFSLRFRRISLLGVLLHRLKLLEGSLCIRTLG